MSAGEFEGLKMKLKLEVRFKKILNSEVGMRNAEKKRIVLQTPWMKKSFFPTSAFRLPTSLDSFPPAVKKTRQRFHSGAIGIDFLHIDAGLLKKLE